mmetsp:Transcript_90610/g.234988  ORF Transcript_90610/g.234988 Transcript_90610/m.234988 type:complete len:120 (+) Transcript_90610:507-866(+)
MLEHQQDELARALAGVRRKMFGSEGSVAVRCQCGYPLMPLGTPAKPLSCAQYKQWSCDGARDYGGCWYGSKAASHLSSLRRYHCPVCLFDLCECCYRARLRKVAVPRTQTKVWDSSIDT